jgi:hypothetical protein
MRRRAAVTFVVLSNVRLPQCGLISPLPPTPYKQASPTMSTEFEERITKQTHIYRSLEQGLKTLHDPQDAELE